MKKPAVWEKGKRFWTLERFALLYVVLWSFVGFVGWFILGIFTVAWAIGMWNRAWKNPNYGYRENGTMKTKLSELF